MADRELSLQMCKSFRIVQPSLEPGRGELSLLDPTALSPHTHRLWPAGPSEHFGVWVIV